jgi:glutamine synthetase type III
MAMIRETPLKYVVAFRVEADSREALEAAIDYVAKHMADGWVVYACGPHACVCKVKLEWDGERLTVKTCLKRSVDTTVKWLLKSYSWYGGKSIRLIKCEEYMP